MDDALLREKGMNPVNRRMASVENFSLVIGARATLVPYAGRTVHGVLFSLTHAEVDALYSEDSVSVYRPEAVFAQLADGSIIPALFQSSRAAFGRRAKSAVRIKTQRTR